MQCQFRARTCSLGFRVLVPYHSRMVVAYNNSGRSQNDTGNN